MKQIKKRFFFNNELKELVVFIKPAPFFTRVILSIVIGISVCIPILVTALSILNRSELKIGLLVSYFIFFGIAFYLFRVLLWNKYGKEVFKFNHDRIEYYADYKYFKDGRQSIVNDKITIGYTELNDEKEPLAQLIIHNEEQEISSCIKLSLNDIKGLINKINF
jgi:hypothetical protein